MSIKSVIAGYCRILGNIIDISTDSMDQYFQQVIGWDLV